MKPLLCCSAILLFLPVYGQVWKYPFAPFEYTYQADTVKKNKRSVGTCSVMQDYTDCSYTEYDRSGKVLLSTEYSNCEDTTYYFYDEPGNPNWTRSVTNGAVTTRTFERDARGNVTHLATSRDGGSYTVTCTYNEADQPLKAVYNDSTYRLYSYENGRVATIRFFKKDRLNEKITVSFSGDTIAYIDCYYDDQGRQYPGERVRGVFSGNLLVEIHTDFAWFTEETDWTPENWGGKGSSVMTIQYTPSGDWESYWDVMSNGNEGGLKSYCNERGDVIQYAIFSGEHHHANCYFTYEYYE